ncbi:McrC family protein [Maribacter flavus]|uniref:Restriction endonuclease n=1 Tax=Maribacter flavus TaxID=1658664 RepID=A0A5B2TSS3_9FLAO|nr:restriction endonuclease [Maribacter flavus]KAA2217193.1 restriction endonuclease [Maribacter flavus]
MPQPRSIISVYEYQKLHYGKEYDTVRFKEAHFNALVKLNELYNNQYFTVIHKGIKFSNYVGVIQVDSLTIQILPKIDNGKDKTSLWRDVLIEMLRCTKKLKVNKVGHANVNKQQIHLLDIYFEWFLNEVKLLQRQGFIKKYYKQTMNVKAFKGKLEFEGHLQKNLVHKERFFTTHQVYGTNHLEHQILNIALDIIEHFSKGSYLYAKCKTVQLDFPDVDLVKPNSKLFSKLVYSRKNQAYKPALEIARFIILNFAPNIAAGQENMLALLFDMNSLWEEYVLAQLKSQNIEGLKVYGQSSKRFWDTISIRPDIVLEYKGETFTIDTKWKNIGGNKPSTNDLRQMYVYNKYWSSGKALLLYPGLKTVPPTFIPFEDSVNQECGIGCINILEGEKLKKDIGGEILGWLKQNSSYNNKI